MPRRRGSAAERDRLLDAAVADGKFSKSRRDHYARLYDEDPEGITAAIGAMHGYGQPLRASEAPGDYDESLLTPAERERVAVLRAGVVSHPPEPSGPAREAASVDDLDTAEPAGGTTAGEDGYEGGFLMPAERARIAAIREGTFRHPAIHVEKQA